MRKKSCSLTKNDNIVFPVSVLTSVKIKRRFYFRSYFYEHSIDSC